MPKRDPPSSILYSRLAICNLQSTIYGGYAMQIQASVFLISAGGSGLGAATARLLAEHRARVVIADINAEAGNAIAAELGERAHFVQTDVTNEADVQRAVDTARDVFGGLHGVVCCAGIGPAER